MASYSFATPARAQSSSCRPVPPCMTALAAARVSGMSGLLLRMYPSRDFPERLTSRYMLLDGTVRRTAMAIEVAASRRLFTREEYYRMGEVGILKRSDHVELIKGEIVTMSPMGLRHRAFVFNLHRLLAV